MKIDETRTGHPCRQASKGQLIGRAMRRAAPDALAPRRADSRSVSYRAILLVQSR